MDQALSIGGAVAAAILGAVLGSLLFRAQPLVQRSSLFIGVTMAALIVAVIPDFADWDQKLFGRWGRTVFSSAVTGLLASTGIGLLLLPFMTQKTLGAVLADASKTRRGVFISYRREDSLEATGRLYDRLSAAFGPENVFRDMDSTPGGVDFREHIKRHMARSDVCLVVIGSRWMSATEADGMRRLDAPGDHVRQEVEGALGLPRMRTIPVLVNAAAMPTIDELPESIRDLCSRNARRVRVDPDFHRDVDDLIRDIQSELMVAAS